MMFHFLKFNGLWFCIRGSSFSFMDKDILCTTCTKFLFKFTRTLKSQDVSKLWKPIKTFQIQSEFGPDPVEHSKPQAAYFNIYSLGGKRDQYYTTCTQIWRVLLGFHSKQTSQTYYHTIGILL